jgi:hypothetical protein
VVEDEMTTDIMIAREDAINIETQQIEDSSLNQRIRG